MTRVMNANKSHTDKSHRSDQIDGWVRPLTPVRRTGGVGRLA
jgi:hypothetical protein